MLKRLLAFCVLAIVLAGTGCFTTGPSDDQNASGGSGSEIVGVAAYPESQDSGTQKSRGPGTLHGLPVALGPVFIFPRFSLPDTGAVVSGTLPSAYTDDEGRFRIRNVPAGTHVLEVNDNGQMGIARSITVPADSQTIDIGVLTVDTTAGVRIRVNTDLQGNLRYYLSVRGTRLVARGTQKGVDLLLDDIPTGISHTITVRIYEPLYQSFDIEEVELVPGEILELDPVSLF